MELVGKIYTAFIKLKKDPAQYFQFKDTNRDGVIKVKDFRYMIYDIFKLEFSDKDFDYLVRRYESDRRRDYIEYESLVEDIEKCREEDEFIKHSKTDPKLKMRLNPSTPHKMAEELKLSRRVPINTSSYKSYSMKNTSCGRRGVSRKVKLNHVPELELVLEEIMKQTYLNDVFVEDHFKAFSDGHEDINLKEFTKALVEINLDYPEDEIVETFKKLKAGEKRLVCSAIDAAVEDTVKKNIEECQKVILDYVYSSLKNDPLSNFNEVFQKFDHDADNKITFDQFVHTLEPRCLNIQVVDLYFLAKRYCTKYDDCVYYKDFAEELNKLVKNIDPVKEWMKDICSDLQKSLAIKNESIYKFFSIYADNNDRITKSKFHDAFEDLKLNKIYDEDRINEFYYYSDINKNEVVSCNELQKTIRTYCQKDTDEFIKDIIHDIANKLIKKKVMYEEFEKDMIRFMDDKGKLYNLFIKQ